MTGAAQKIPAVAAAIALGLGLLSFSRCNSAFAQNEAEPEDTPIETPQAEPTEWVPITAGDAARGGPAPTAEAAPSPAQTSSPGPAAAEAPATAPRTTIPHSTTSRERTPKGSRAGGKESAESLAPNAAASMGAAPPHKESKTGGGPQIVPESSPFSGMNFGTQKGPIDINSDTGTLDYQKRFFLYTGHVHAVQAGGDLTSDTLKVQYGQDFNDIKMIYADGNVRMSQATRWITSDHAILDQAKHILKFLGNPVVHDGEDQITGSVIAVDLVTGKSTVQNPRMVIFPRESKNPDNVDAPGSP